VDTSDLDEIEAEYYFDKAVDQKVNLDIYTFIGE
jgi:hypothetical protein